jgi:hypothetical protein
MRISIALLVCLLSSTQATSESLDFAVYRLSDNGPALISEEKLDYSVCDVEVLKWGSTTGRPTWKKTLKLAEGFRIGVLVTRTDEVPGFGLWIQNDQHPEGFSWEWFNLEEGDIFVKLKGEGRVRVTRGAFEDGVEIQSVEFLADIKLRFSEDMKLGPRVRTHEVMVSKGSVFRFAL